MVTRLPTRTKDNLLSAGLLTNNRAMHMAAAEQTRLGLRYNRWFLWQFLTVWKQEENLLLTEKTETGNSDVGLDRGEMEKKGGVEWRVKTDLTKRKPANLH